MSTANKVGLVFNGRYDEAPAHDGNIKPGHLLDLLSTGKVDGHASSGGITPPRFAFEDALSNRGGDGLTAVKSLFDAFATDDIVPYGYALPGDIIQAWLPAAATAVVIDSELMSNGDGTLVLKTSTNHIVAYATEAIDNSAGADPVRIAVRIR